LQSPSNPRPAFEGSSKLVVKYKSKYGRFRHRALRDMSEVSPSDTKTLCIAISPRPTAETIRSGTLDDVAEPNRAVGSGGWVESAGSAGKNPGQDIPSCDVPLLTGERLNRRR